MPPNEFVGPLTCCFCAEAVTDPEEYLEASVHAPAVPDRHTASHRFGMHAQCLLDRLSEKHRPGAEPLV